MIAVDNRVAESLIQAQTMKVRIRLKTASRHSTQDSPNQFVAHFKSAGYPARQNFIYMLYMRIHLMSLIHVTAAA
jgi:hypothetical protein